MRIPSRARQLGATQTVDVAAGGAAPPRLDPTAPPPPRRTPERAAAPGDDAVPEEIERALTRVARTVLRLGVPAHELRTGEHIDRSGYWTLVRLDEAAGPLRLSDLAGVLDLDLSTVSRQARHLADAGLVVRESDPVDGRACLVSLSARGRAVLDAVREGRQEVVRSAMSGWSGRERAAMARALVRLADDLQATTAEPTRPRPALSGSDAPGAPA